eukprot:4481058-Amphidinium_carterae.1
MGMRSCQRTQWLFYALCTLRAQRRTYVRFWFRNHVENSATSKHPTFNHVHFGPHFSTNWGAGVCEVGARRLREWTACERPITDFYEKGELLGEGAYGTVKKWSSPRRATTEKRTPGHH